MNQDLTDWDENLLKDPETEYKAIVRSLKRTSGFRLLFVECSPAEGTKLIQKIKEDIPQKKIEVLPLNEPTNNLYNLVAGLPNRQDINILFVTGLENSLYEYELNKLKNGWSSNERYSYSEKGVPPILSHLNQHREKFRDDFNICFVFILPVYALKYFIHRCPDFFDWRSNTFEFKSDPELVAQESSRIIEEGNYQKYQSFSSEERRQKFLDIQNLIEDENNPDEQKGKLLVKQGLILASESKNEEAIAAYDKALEIKQDYYKVWNAKGNALRYLGRYEEAIAAYDKALEIKPYFHEAWYNKGIVMSDLERYKQAISAYEKALEIKQDFHEAWSKKGDALLDLGRYEEALAACEKALEIKQDFHEAWYYKGAALRFLGKYEEEIAACEKAIEIKPDYGYAWNGKGIDLFYLGRYEQAISAFEKAIEIKPDFHYAWFHKGYVLSYFGRYEQAIAACEKAIEIKPDFDHAWYFRGALLWRLLRFKEGYASIMKGREINPYFPVDYFYKNIKRLPTGKSGWYNLKEFFIKLLRVIVLKI
ncbi:MAG: tetratricopeptide repeat protein [Okeania sp. SIO3B5]|uniref:tetratricopeptide repeat protein n=1 Tax=Okeania sp. SIO3B5 TaxID=2607811 RepID=UPI00140109EE|nr:tetratricopeptide repeat protein [Okeania sp. SIO3B5]NEO53541.1 tetratricopeptide repeat protein [Okeania sp. SIO3B5]